MCGVSNPIGLKLKFYETCSGEVTAETVVPEQYQGYPGIVHGGIVAAMLDEVSGRAHIRGDPPRFMFTARLEVRYRKNVPVGKPLRLVGKAGKTKVRSAMASAAIYDIEGTLLAEADAVLVEVPEEVVGSVDLNALGWRVYADPEGEGEKG